jgi:glycosyltransferase involved in cell wall biosynthesis
LTYYDESQYNEKAILKLVRLKKYDVAYVCGRVEAKYLNVCRFLRVRGIPVIGTTDEQLNGSFKQRMVRFFSWYLYRQYFDFVMVPGYRQKLYMNFIGFDSERILQGSYSCDVSNKNLVYQNEGRLFNKRCKLLFVGRFEKEKGVAELLHEIERLNSHGYSFTIKLIGSGSLLDDFAKYSFVEVVDFCTQGDFFFHTKDIRYFVLPSIYEPWGVVVHEFASLGLPLILSDKVGSGDSFLIDSWNGFLFYVNEQKSLASALIKAHNIDEDSWKVQSKNSIILSNKINEYLWADHLLRISKEYSKKLPVHGIQGE